MPYPFSLDGTCDAQTTHTTKLPGQAVGHPSTCSRARCCHRQPIVCPYFRGTLGAPPPLATYPCPFLEPSPSARGGAHRALTPECPVGVVCTRWGTQTSTSTSLRDAPGLWTGGGGWVGARDALEGKGPQRRPLKRLDTRLEGVAQAVGGRLLSVTNAIEGGNCRPGDSGWA